jgi:hypothetical protein
MICRSPEICQAGEPAQEGVKRRANRRFCSELLDIQMSLGDAAKNVACAGTSLSNPGIHADSLIFRPAT